MFSKMKNVLHILMRDLLELAKNPIALLVVGALLVLPGLYAWYCIIANWDPYSNTGNMPIAVVNHDRGASSDLAGEVDVGKQVVEKLEDNDSISWRFYEEEARALEDTRDGFVYATLVLPGELSESLIGIFEGSQEQPTIYYYPNEKYNAVATKVTDSAAQTLVRQINQSFSSTVNEKILVAVQAGAGKAKVRAGETHRSALAQVKDVQADLAEVVGSLDDAKGVIAGWQDAAGGTREVLSALDEQLPPLKRMLAKGARQLTSVRKKAAAFEGDLSSTVLNVTSTVSALSSKASSTVSAVTGDLKAVQAGVDSLMAAVDGDEDLGDIVTGITLVSGIVSGVLDSADARVQKFDSTVQGTAGRASVAVRTISKDASPKFITGASELSTALSDLSASIARVEPQVEQLDGVVKRTDSTLSDTTVAIDDAQGLLASVSDGLEDTVADMGAIGGALEIDQLSDLLSVDPANLNTFLSSPVQVSTEKVFPVSNYGTAVAPFYTNLALWIGCFILVSLMKVEAGVEGVEGATSRQRYFGRWLLFVILSLLQSQVICGVDILLGIDCAHPVLFMLAGAACSFTYMNLIYALVKTFRNVGKTLCIFLLIMQVPGSSGMYPIEMMPGFFQFIHPALPFTYGIGAMREALCGMQGNTYVGALCVFASIVLFSLIIGLFLRQFMVNLLAMFDEEMNKTGFFASEVDAYAEPDRLRGMVRTLAASEAYGDDIEERAVKFNRTYPRIRKACTIATFAVPFVFLILIFPFNVTMTLSANVKLGSLIIMLAVLFAVLLTMIVVEYAHRSIEDEMRLLGASILGAAPDDAGVLGATAAAPGRAHGGPARDIFATDLSLGFHSVVGVVVIMLLVITPSLYAWFNIAGSWDPYSSTGNLKVAVANVDEGYKGELIPVTVNIGDTIVAQLRGNDSFDWVFTGKDEAVAGVEDSSYYAAIEIPADFSRDMLTYLTSEGDYPGIIYYTNEKENPIAPIITQKGADSVQESIRVSFTERIDEVALSVAYDLLGYLTTPEMRSYASTMNDDLDSALHDAESASRELVTLAGISSAAADISESAGASIDGLEAAAKDAGKAVRDTRAGISDASGALSVALSAAKKALSGEKLDVDKANRIIKTVYALLSSGAESASGAIDDLIDDMREIRSDASSDEQKSKCTAVIKALKKAKKRAQKLPGSISAAQNKTTKLVSKVDAQVEDAKAFASEELEPSIAELRSTLSSITSSASEVASGLKEAVEGIGESTGGLSNQLETLSSGLREAGSELRSTADGIGDARDRVVEALSSGDVMQMEAVILGGDPELMAQRLAAPVQQERQPVYSVANYGSAMAPFYTVLSLWVGALVMISTMRVRVVEERIEQLRECYPKLRLRHEFFGRYGIFGFIGLLQGLLVLLGDLMLLHVQCENPMLFLLFGLFIGQAFCLIVYTITELFGDVGKALCVILLIMQVAASGGTFPVQMLDPLLSGIVPFLPFYHAMSLLQECVAGIFWPGAVLNTVALVAMVGGILLLGVPLRRPFRKLNDFFEEQLEKTGYM